MRAVRVLAIPQPPPARGKLLTVQMVRAMFPEGAAPSDDWLWKNLPHKLKIGRRSFWWSDDVTAWLEELRETEAA